MRRVLSALSLLAVSATIASAADIPPRAPARAPVAVPYYNWTGFYIGVSGGGGWGQSTWDGLGSGTGSGGLIGGTLGYNWHAPGSPWVFGVEGDLSWSGIRASTCSGCETRNTWLYTGRGRIGYAIDRVLPYFTGGLAVGNIETNRAGFATESTTKAGWTIGGGLEAALAPQWTGKLEYLYVDLGSTGCSAASCGATANASFQTHIVRAGLNFRF